VIVPEKREFEHVVFGQLDRGVTDVERAIYPIRERVVVGGLKEHGYGLGLGSRKSGYHAQTDYE
jgi:hypothetical protein